MTGMKIDWTHITGITEDSRLVQDGYLFAALPGGKSDGTQYVATALQRGARALLVPRGIKTDAPESVQVIESDSPRRDFALACAAFYARQPQTIVGVTGTSGKTSIVSILAQLWAARGVPAGTIGTLGAVAPDWHVKDDTMTTPPPEKLFGFLRRMADTGVTHAAMEATSHAMHQHRVDGVRFSAAAFCNLSRDHLDYHHDMESYFQAKLRLFDQHLPEGSPAIVWCDDPYGLRVAEQFAQRHLICTVGSAPGAFLRLMSVTPYAAGQELELEHDGRRVVVHLPLSGRFQAENACIALACVLALEPSIRLVDMVSAMENLQSIEGRLQSVTGHPRGAGIYVDYAHKPEGLIKVLDTLRPHVTGKLICVFGCGGNRDAGKRPIMGGISADKADVTIITDDNPRFEDAGTIRAQIAAAAPNALNIGDRRVAIRRAINMADAGDVVLIAGKGHETYQIIGDAVVHFSDVEEVEAAIREMQK